MLTRCLPFTCKLSRVYLVGKNIFKRALSPRAITEYYTPPGAVKCVQLQLHKTSTYEEGTKGTGGREWERCAERAIHRAKINQRHEECNIPRCVLNIISELIDLRGLARGNSSMRCVRDLFFVARTISVGLLVLSVV